MNIEFKIYICYDNCCFCILKNYVNIQFIDEDFYKNMKKYFIFKVIDIQNFVYKEKRLGNKFVNQNMF